jgi:hypothetical protein
MECFRCMEGLIARYSRIALPRAFRASDAFVSLMIGAPTGVAFLEELLE